MRQSDVAGHHERWGGLLGGERAAARRSGSRASSSAAPAAASTALAPLACRATQACAACSGHGLHERVQGTHLSFRQHLAVDHRLAPGPAVRVLLRRHAHASARARPPRPPAPPTRAGGGAGAQRPDPPDRGTSPATPSSRTADWPCSAAHLSAAAGLTSTCACPRTAGHCPWTAGPGPLQRRGGQLRISGPELDDLAYRGAADALLAIDLKLGQFRGEQVHDLGLQVRCV
jgi:hypothetical protein